MKSVLFTYTSIHTFTQVQTVNSFATPASLKLLPLPPQAPAVSLQIAAALPHNNYSDNAFRNSFFYQVGLKLCICRVELGWAARSGSRQSLKLHSRRLFTLPPNSAVSRPGEGEVSLSLLNQFHVQIDFFFKGYPVDRRMASEISVFAESSVQPTRCEALVPVSSFFFCCCLCSGAGSYATSGLIGWRGFADFATQN